MDNFLKSVFSYVSATMVSTFPAVKAQEEEAELVDYQTVFREECSGHCTALKEKYDTCNERVRSKTKTTEICSEELIDFLHCIDHCVTPKLFPKLK